MGRRGVQPRKQIIELLEGRPGWRLEPRTTPGASPLWCFVSEGEIEYSATVENGVVRLYVMASDQEVVFENVDALTAWLEANRPESMQDVPPRPGGKERFKGLLQWE